MISAHCTLHCVPSILFDWNVCPSWFICSCSFGQLTGAGDCHCSESGQSKGLKPVVTLIHPSLQDAWRVLYHYWCEKRFFWPFKSSRRPWKLTEGHITWYSWRLPGQGGSRFTIFLAAILDFHHFGFLGVTLDDRNEFSWSQHISSQSIMWTIMYDVNLM